MKFRESFVLSPSACRSRPPQRHWSLAEKTLSAVLNGKAGISPEMAIRLSIAFDTSAESWLNQESQCELWHAEQHRKELNVKKLVAA